MSPGPSLHASRVPVMAWHHVHDVNCYYYSPDEKKNTKTKPSLQVRSISKLFDLSFILETLLAGWTLYHTMTLDRPYWKALVYMH